MKAQTTTKQTRKTDGHKAPKGASFSQKQRKGRGSNPNSLQNLKRFQPGRSGNPGGLPKGTPKVSIALMNLLAMRPDDEFRPASRAECIALALYEKAMKGDVT